MARRAGLLGDVEVESGRLVNETLEAAVVGVVRLRPGVRGGEVGLKGLGHDRWRAEGGEVLSGGYAADAGRASAGGREGRVWGERRVRGEGGRHEGREHELVAGEGKTAEELSVQSHA